MGADVADRAAVRVRQRWQVSRPLPSGGGRAGGGWAPGARRMRPLMAERFAHVVARPLWGAQGGVRRSGGSACRGRGSRA